jgi:putative DNA primase/helicase
MNSTKRHKPIQKRKVKSAVQIEDWPEPSPLGEELPPVQPFTEDMLPEVLRGPCVDAAERMQTPLDFPAATGIVCYSGAAQRRLRVQPKALQIDWQEGSNLWGGLIGAPGILLKSPVQRYVAKPLYDREKQWSKDHARELDRHRRQLELERVRRGLERDQIQQILQDNPAATVDDLPELAPPAQPPIPRRLIANDASYQKLQELLIENPAGLLCLHDELTKFLSDLDQSGNESARSFFLQSWNGNMPYNIDRIGRGEKRLAALSLSVFGGIAPDRLRSYLGDVLKGGPGNDGLIQRFSVMVWPDTTSWKYVDLTPVQHIKLEEMYTRVFRIDPENPVVYRFRPGATQQYFVVWLTRLEDRIRSGSLHPSLVSHIAKYRKLVPVLAGLYTFADDASDEWIDLPYLEQAVRTSECLESHAVRVYSCVASPSLQAARSLLDKVQRRVIARDGILHTRELYRHHWSGLDERSKVQAALDILEDTNHLRRCASEPDRRLGRPSQSYRVNPRIWRKS